MSASERQFLSFWNTNPFFLLPFQTRSDLCEQQYFDQEDGKQPIRRDRARTDQQVVVVPDNGQDKVKVEVDVLHEQVKTD